MHACLCFEEEISGERPEFTKTNSSEAVNFSSEVVKLYFKRGRTELLSSEVSHSNSGYIAIK